MAHGPEARAATLRGNLAQKSGVIGVGEDNPLPERRLRVTRCSVLPKSSEVIRIPLESCGEPLFRIGIPVSLLARLFVPELPASCEWLDVIDIWSLGPLTLLSPGQP